MLGNFNAFCFRLLAFLKINFQKNLSVALSLTECRRLGPTDKTMVLIWVQTVCKGYQQMKQVAACWVILMPFYVVVCCLFSKLTFSKNSYSGTYRVSNSLDPDQDRENVDSDLGPNCLKRLSAYDKSPCMLGNFNDFCCRLPVFLKINFSKSSFCVINRVSSSLNTDHDRQNVGPDLGPNCLQRLSADEKSRCILGNFNVFCCWLLTFFHFFFKIFFQELYQSDKRFGPRSAPT